MIPINPYSNRRSFLKTALALTAQSSFSALSFGAIPPRIKIGQIGTRHAHALGKLQTILKFPQLYDLVGVVEADPARRKELTSNPIFGNIRWIDEAQLLETPGLQVVAIETEVSQLLATAQRCADASLHLHLDKPAGSSLPEFRRLLQTMKTQGKTLQMGYMFRYNPAFQALFEMVRKGWLGTLTEVQGGIGKNLSDEGRKELESYWGGGFFELACHLLDATVTLLGRPNQIASVHHRTFPEKDSFADNQVAILDYPTAIATLRCNHIDPFGGPRRHFNVTGTLGTCEIRPLEPPQVRLYLNEPREDLPAEVPIDLPLQKMTGRYDGEFLDLAKVVRGEKKLEWTPEHDEITQETLLRICEMPLH